MPYTKLEDRVQKIEHKIELMQKEDSLLCSRLTAVENALLAQKEAFVALVQKISKGEGALRVLIWIGGVGGSIISLIWFFATKIQLKD